MMFLVLYFPTAFNTLRETGRPPSLGRLEGTLFSHAGRATKHYEEKKAPGDYKIVPGNLSKVPKLPTFVV